MDEMEERKEELTIDELVDRIVPGKPNCVLFLLFFAVAPAMNTPAKIYLTIFAGAVPYTEWNCTSDRCLDLLEEQNGTYSKNLMCGNGLVAEKDFAWNSSRTSFATEWGLYCGEEYKLSIVNSFFFVGACVGLICSTAIFDRVGRKYGALIGTAIGTLGSLSGLFVPNYPALLVVRVVQGFGQFITLTGVYCWVLEFAPSHLRNLCNGGGLSVWCCGYIAIVGLSYLIPYWRHIFLAAAVLNVITALPLCCLPQSPRFLLVQGREDEARRVLTAYSRISGNPVKLEGIKIVYKKRVQSFLQQLTDFRVFPALGKETLRLLLAWFIIGALFYGFSFGWGKLSADLYTSYMFAAAGKFIAMASTIPVCAWLGPKKAVLLFLSVGLLSNFLAMPDLMFGEKWSLEYVSCLIGSMGVSAAFGVLYLFTGELAPTSHRGMVLSLSSSAARIGSFIGPYMSLMYNVADRRVPLVVFAVLTVLCGTAVWFQPDTTGRRIPETPKDVEVYAGNKNYQEIDTGKSTV